MLKAHCCPIGDKHIAKSVRDETFRQVRVMQVLSTGLLTAITRQHNTQHSSGEADTTVAGLSSYCHQRKYALERAAPSIRGSCLFGASKVLPRFLCEACLKVNVSFIP